MKIPQTLTLRQIVFGGLLLAAVVGLGIELIAFAPYFLERPLNDYAIYARWGSAARSGIWNPPEQYNPYPLPTTLWIFVPLSLLPDWFKVVWTIGPYLILLYLYGKPGLIWWVFYPMMVQGGVGQMDAWLLLPLAWVLDRRPWLAGIGAVLLLFKPQIAWLTVLAAFVLWLVQRDKKNLGAFVITLAVLYIPAFVLDPLWFARMLQPMSVRAREFLLPTRGATIWGWWWHGDWAVWLIPLWVLLAIVLAARVIKPKPLHTAQLVNLLITPVLYASNLSMLIPTIRRTRDIILLTCVSWFGVLLDNLFGGFGGVYILLPLTALWLLSEPKILRAQAQAA